MIQYRCLYDVALFARLFFSHHCRLPFSPFHYFIFDRYKDNIAFDIFSRKGKNFAFAAPRGSAKSTITSLILPIHSLIYQLERYIILISATLTQASLKLSTIKNELITNELLKCIYGEFKEKGEHWSRRSIIAKNVKIDAFSAGTELRGISFNEFRPTRIILDDCEDSRKVMNPNSREQLYEWFCEVIENLGDVYTNINVVGTVLHQESLLSRLIKRPDYQTAIFRSIINFSSEQSLWNKWREIYTDLVNPNRSPDAYNFFVGNKEAMLKNAKVLWEEKEDYYYLMSQLVTKGRKAFFKEKQNDPRSDESQIFSLEKMEFFRIEGTKIVVEKSEMKIPLTSLIIYGFLDPSMGNSKHKSKKLSDYASIATIGKDSAGFIYVLNIWMDRVPPSRQIKKIFELHEHYRYSLFGIETNNFQKLLLEPLEDERVLRRSQGLVWDVPIIEVNQHANKIERISTLETSIANGWILFNRDLSEEFYQLLEQFPTAMYDDPLDALESAIKIAKVRIINDEQEENFIFKK